MSTASSSSLLLEPADPNVCHAPTITRFPRIVDDVAVTSDASPIVAAPAIVVKKRRDLDLDACRVLASLGVVWVHSATALPSGVGRFAVPMFTITSMVFCALALRKRPDEPSAVFVARRWAKLYPAFLFWCAAFAALGQAKRILAGEWYLTDVHAVDFIGGTQQHLWFLPFLLVGTCVAVPALRLAVRRPPAGAPMGGTAAACGSAWASAPVPARVSAWGPTSPWHWLVHAWWATPSLFMGVALGCLAIARNDGIRVPRPFGLVGLLLFVVGSYVNWSVVYEPVRLGTTAAGVGMFWIAGSGLLPRRIVAALAPIGAFGMGIYLCHPVILHVMTMAADHFRVPPAPAIDVARFASAMTGALAMAWLLNRSRWTRWTIGV